MSPRIDADGRIQLYRDPDVVSMDAALTKIFNAHGLERVGGASGRGWSRAAAIQKCLYYYKKVYVDGMESEPSAPLEIGSLFHTFLALFYWPDPTERPFDEEYLRDAVLHEGAAPESVAEAWRLFEHYAFRWQEDYLVPLAVELFAEDRYGNTCRYDLIAKVPEPQPGVSEGTWIVEHKTASRFTADVTEGWANDGEIIGQVMIYEDAGLVEEYGPLQGVIVNITGKQQTPQFTRVVVPVKAWQVEAHRKDLDYWEAVTVMCAATDTWPRSRNSCVGRYGRCALFDHCAGL